MIYQYLISDSSQGIMRKCECCQSGVRATFQTRYVWNRIWDWGMIILEKWAFVRITARFTTNAIQNSNIQLYLDMFDVSFTEFCTVIYRFVTQKQVRTKDKNADEIYSTRGESCVSLDIDHTSCIMYSILYVNIPFAVWNLRPIESLEYTWCSCHCEGNNILLKFHLW